MTKIISIDGKDYNVTDEEQIHSDEILIFEIRNYSDKVSKFVLCNFYDLLGSPIKKVWKILK